MADLTLLSGNKQGRPQPTNDVTLSVRAGASATALQALHTAADGDMILSDASVAGTAIFDGLLLNNSASDGDAITIISRGAVYGFDLSAQDYGDVIYLSDTAGALADAAGTVSVPVGKVIKLNGEKVVWLGLTA